MTNERCAVTEDLNRHLAKLDEQEQYEGALEKAYLDLVGELITGACEDDALYEEIEDALDPVFLMRVFLDYNNPDNAGLFERLKGQIRKLVERRAQELAPKRVEAERDAAEESAAEKQAEDRGLLR